MHRPFVAEVVTKSFTTQHTFIQLLFSFPPTQKLVCTCAGGALVPLSAGSACAEGVGPARRPVHTCVPGRGSLHGPIRPWGLVRRHLRGPEGKKRRRQHLSVGGTGLPGQPPHPTGTWLRLLLCHPFARSPLWVPFSGSSLGSDTALLPCSGSAPPRPLAGRVVLVAVALDRPLARSARARGSWGSLPSSARKRAGWGRGSERAAGAGGCGDEKTPNVEDRLTGLH